MQFRTNLNRFKEPRGFIKIIQFVIAILAFATTGSYYSEFKVQVTRHCPNITNKSVTHNELIKFSYPFKIIDYYFDGDVCQKISHERHTLGHNYKSGSEFFVFVGVVSFLYCIIAMVYYVVLEDPAKYGPGGTDRVVVSFATVDFLITIVLGLFWFAGSIAWAAALTSLKESTDAKQYIKDSPKCQISGARCKVLSNAGYASLTISVLFGFLSCFLWCCNVWFVYKETIWHKEPGATTTAEQPSSEIPRQQVPSGEEIP